MFWLLWADPSHQRWIENIAAQKVDPKMQKAIANMLNQTNCCGSASQKSEKTSENDHEWQLYIFMSFSVPIQIWKDLLAEQHLHPFVFVIKGLPNNSFKALYQKIKDAQIPLIIHPDLFEEMNITQVPAFVLKKQGRHVGVCGNITLKHALERLLSLAHDQEDT